MPEAAQVFGDRLEAVYGQWVEARKADESLERLPDPDDEMLRQVLWAANAPTSLDTGQAIAHLDQGERNKYNQLLSKVNGVNVTHPGAPPRGMVMVDKSKPVEPVIFRRGVPSNRGDPCPPAFSAGLVPRRWRRTVSAGKRSLGIGPRHRQPRQPADRTCDCQSRLATSVRRRPGANLERFRHSRRAADSSEIARSLGRRVHGRWLVHQAIATPHHALGYLATIEQRP